MDKIIFDSAPPNQSKRTAIISMMTKNYPFLELIYSYKSLLNRQIPVLHIGNKEKSILLAASFHGMEWMTTIVLLKFMDELCQSIKINSLKNYNLDKRGITFIPCVNPDGVEISLGGMNTAGRFKNLVEKIGKTHLWQANARGVDLNHNFDAGWQDLHLREIKSGIVAPARTRYGGEFPESEPETQALTDICKKIPFDCVFAFHSQGEEIYWDYGKKTPEYAKSIADKLSFLSEYKVSSPDGLAVGGGFKDWFISKFEKPGFTIEIGKGQNPLPLIDFESIYKKIKKMMFFIPEINIPKD